MEILRNILRRKLRSFLTIFGISVGIFAVTVMGSMSEYFNNLVTQSLKYSAAIVRVFPKSAAGPGILPTTDADQFRKIPEVKEVAPALLASFEEDPGGNFLTSDSIIGLPPESSSAILGGTELRSGRFLKKDDQDQIILGSGLATKLSAKIGGKEKIRDKEFEVVGIIKKTQIDQIDNLAILPLTHVQDFSRLPGFANALILVPKETKDTQKIADTVKKDFPKFNALSPEDVVNETRRGLLIFNVIILAGAFLAVIVGGFSTLNTMIMSITERTREIGIKKAIGASQLTILKEYLLESAFIGFLGGLLGLGLGYLGTIAINQTTKNLANGLEIFSLTPRLAALALLFAVVLGGLAGLLPAISASRLNIVKALKEL